MHNALGSSLSMMFRVHNALGSSLSMMFRVHNALGSSLSMMFRVHNALEVDRFMRLRIYNALCFNRSLDILNSWFKLLIVSLIYLPELLQLLFTSFLQASQSIVYESIIQILHYFSCTKVTLFLLLNTQSLLIFLLNYLI